MPEITQERLDDLEKKKAWLDALAAAGVDNWEGYSHAYDIFKEWGWEDEE